MKLENNTQTSIVRQSSLKFTVEYLNMIKSPLGLMETVAVTELISEYVVNGFTPDIKQRLQKFDGFIQSVDAENIVQNIKFEMSSYEQ
jgi:hypothetical protein